MTLKDFNTLKRTAAIAELARCCGSSRWVAGMLERRPFASVTAMKAAADAVWAECGEADGREAFTHHPKIGDMDKLREKFAATAGWSGNEQAGVDAASEAVLQGLAQGNAEYEARFGYIFIVCATGKSAAEMLALLEGRLHNEPADEIRIAMAEQHKITHLRLQKLLS